jgi:heat shock protein HslJ
MNSTTLFMPLLLGMLCLGTITGCHTIQCEEPLEPNQALQASAWRLVSNPLPAGDSLTQHTIDFAVEDFSGTLACNGVGGGYAATADGYITLDVQVMTEMYCGKAPQLWASHIQTQLERVDTYQIEGNTLILESSQEEARLVYERQ